MPAALPTTFPFKPTVLFTDVDETLTWEGRLPPETFNALVALQQANISVVPVTGASAGWCDCMIRTWPIDSIIGENGAFFIDRDKRGRFNPTYAVDEAERNESWERLQTLKEQVLNQFPQAFETADQAFRKTDIAFDIGQDRKVERSEAALIQRYCLAAGFTAKMSSIHINVWSGQYSKSTMAKKWLDTHNVNYEKTMFVGDSPNDESMFESFPASVGVSNIIPYIPELNTPPAFVTTQPGGFGFNELSIALLNAS